MVDAWSERPMVRLASPELSKALTNADVTLRWPAVDEPWPTIISRPEATGFTVRFKFDAALKLPTAPRSSAANVRLVAEPPLTATVPRLIVPPAPVVIRSDPPLAIEAFGSVSVPEVIGTLNVVAVLAKLTVPVVVSV